MTTNTIKTYKTTNDPISDFLTRIRNAILIKQESVLVPFSKLKLHLCEILKQEGFISSFEILNEDSAPKKAIQITLKYGVDGSPVITGLQRISKPGLRKYTRAQEAPRVLNGLGISIISTNKGLITDRIARREKLGGEVLCEVW